MEQLPSIPSRWAERQSMFACQSRQNRGLNWPDNPGWSRMAITDFLSKTVTARTEATRYHESFSISIGRNGRMLSTDSVEDSTVVFSVMLSRYAPAVHVNIVISG